MTVQTHIMKPASSAPSRPPPVMSRRRPKRQRTPTTIYTDDNPRTFTTKKKKGESDESVGATSHPSSATNNGKKSPWHFPEETTSSSRRSSSMPPPGSKRGPGRPPRKRLSLDDVGSSSSSKSSKNSGKSDSNIQVKKPTAAQNNTSSYSTSTAIPATMPDTSSTKSHLVVEVSLASESLSSTCTTNSTMTPLPVPDSSTTTSTLATPSPMKRKRGRPPKNPPKEENNVEMSSAVRPNGPTEVTAPASPITKVWKPNRSDRDSIPGTVNGGSSHAQTQLSSAARSGKINSIGPSNTPSKGSKRSIKGDTRSTSRAALVLKSAESWTPPQEDLEGTFISHSVTVAPILPPNIVHDKNDSHRGGPANKNRTENENDHHRSTTSSLTRDEQEKLERQLGSRYPVVFERGVPRACTSSLGLFVSREASATATASGISSSSTLKQPSWTPLYAPPVYFDDDYEETDKGNGFPVLDLANTIPITRKITSLTVRKPHDDYLALGDSAGFVLIYSLGKDNVSRPVARLESVACQQRGKMEQERLRTEFIKRRKKSNTTHNANNKGTKTGLALFDSSASNHSSGIRPNTPTGPQQLRSILIDTSETTIHALGMIGDRVVLATSVELECMDVPSATSLWVCPLSSNRFVTSLDMHLNTYDVLVSCSKTNDSSASFMTADASTNPSSPLMLLQHSKHNVEICDANSPMLVRSPSCTAIWDVGCNTRLLFVALSSNRQELELVLVSGGSIDTWKVACKTKIPIRNSGGGAAGGSSNSSLTTTTKLSQSPGGVYTLVASSRGIRLYQTESLQLIHVYGDQLALHGQSVLWKDCWLAGSYFSERKGCHKARGTSSLLECGDWLAETDGSDDVASQDKDMFSTTPDLAPYIIGVPNVNKGPKELCENLHVWKVEHPSVVPAMSIPLPAKADGALGLVGGGGGDRLILVTNDGQGHMLMPRMESNFAGIMYPPGYQIITDNIEYIEDEDALDKVVEPVGEDFSDDDEDDDVDIMGDDDGDDEMDDELREAMRISLLEHKRQEVAREAVKHDKDVDILVRESDAEPNYLPCRPEAYLRQEVNAHVEDDEDEETDNDEQDQNSDPSVKTSEKKKESKACASIESSAAQNLSAGEIFTANILDILPNVHKPIQLEEDCLSFTTTKVVVAVNPVIPPRPGRGRKSRPSNLESMLKASINPYLQSWMISRQGIASDGSGSRLGKMTEFESEPSLSEFDSNHNRSKSSAEASFFATGTGNNQPQDFGSKDDNPSLSHFSRASLPAFESDVSRKHSTGLPVAIGQDRAPVHMSASADEAAVVLGLLGLSPCTAGLGSGISSATSGRDTEAKGSDSETKPTGSDYKSPYLNASSLSTWAARVENSVAAAIQTPLHSLNQHHHSGGGSGNVESLSASSDRGSESEALASDHPMSKQDIVDKTCSACRGRHVIHMCGRRSLPIDYDEIAKAEREQREQEEEEKKRIRAEKRRLADQKRREARKQKQVELEQQRHREEEEERLEKERQRQLQEDFAAQDLNRKRREQIVASYAEFEAQGTIEMNSVDYNLQSESASRSAFEQAERPLSTISSIGESQRVQVSNDFEQASRTTIVPSPPRNKVVLKRPASAGQAAASYRKTAPATHEHGIYSLHSNNENISLTGTSPFSKESMPSSSPSAQVYASASATLASADALVALANFADATAAIVETTKAESGEGTDGTLDNGSFSRYSHGITPRAADASTPTSSTSPFAALHGFGGGVPTPSTSISTGYVGETRRGIPSYAAIRGQLNNSEPLSSTGNPFGNGSSRHEAPAVESYVVWPPRRED